MAEGYARQWAPPGWEVYSAGVRADGMNPRTIAAMDEVGVDIRGQHSKTVDAVPWEDLDLVVTLCGHAAAACPALPPHAEHRHWPIEDPARAWGDAEAVMGAYRTAREEIKGRVESLVGELAGRDR